MAAASTVDRFFPAADPDVLDVWHGLLADVPLEVAREAFRYHYRGSSETITPHDIVAVWRSRRQHPPVPGCPPRSRDQIHAGVDRAIAALAERKALTSGEDRETAAGIAEGEANVRRLYRSIPCPHCQAEVGRPCVTGKGVSLTKSPAHPARIEAAQVNVRGNPERFSRA